MGVATPLLSNLILGMGPFLPWQMLGWGLMGLLAYYIPKNRLAIAGYGFTMGFVYGWLLNLWWIGAGMVPLSFTTLFVYSFPLEINHALTNLALLLALPYTRIDRLVKSIIR